MISHALRSENIASEAGGAARPERTGRIWGICDGCKTDKERLLLPIAGPATVSYGLWLWRCAECRRLQSVTPAGLRARLAEP